MIFTFEVDINFLYFINPTLLMAVQQRTKGSYPLLLGKKCKSFLWKLKGMPRMEIGEIYLSWVAILFCDFLTVQRVTNWHYVRKEAIRLIFLCL